MCLKVWPFPQPPAAWQLTSFQQKSVAIGPMVRKFHWGIPWAELGDLQFEWHFAWSRRSFDWACSVWSLGGRPTGVSWKPKNAQKSKVQWKLLSVTKARWGLTAFALGLHNSQQARQHQVRSISNFVTRPFSMDEVAFGILPECQSRRQLKKVGCFILWGIQLHIRLTDLFDLLIEKHIKAYKNQIFDGMWLLPIKCFEFLQQVFAAVLSSLGLHSPTWAERVRPLDRTSALL